MTWKERLSRIIAFGMYDRMITPHLPENIGHYVAAGNPGKTFSEYPVSLQIPPTFTMGKKLCRRQDYELYTVSGNSMLPEGIRSGYELLTLPIVADNVHLGDFIIITVDDGFYQVRHQGKKSHFVQKLRRAICAVDDQVTAEQLCARLAGTFAEAFEIKEKSDLRESLEQARQYYGRNRLFLSVTYHDGDIHYSFHPADSIRYRVEGAAYINGADTLSYKTASELTA